jgi:hypothetical protein
MISNLSSFQFSGTGNMPRGKWLLFLDFATTLEDFMADIYIPLDCEFVVAQRSGRKGREGEVSLTEVYKLRPSRELQTNPVAEWTPEEGLAWSDVPFFERRSGLQGLSLKSAMIYDVRNRFIILETLPATNELDIG